MSVVASSATWNVKEGVRARARVCVCVCVWNTSRSRRGEVQRGDLFLSLVKWPPVFAAVLEKDYQACNSRLADSVTRTPLVCATRVAVVNVSIVRSRGPRGGMSNDLILATRRRRGGGRKENRQKHVRRRYGFFCDSFIEPTPLCNDTPAAFSIPSFEREQWAAFLGLHGVPCFLNFSFFFPPSLLPTLEI